MADLFVSDFHFGHRFMLAACRRPFLSLSQMDKTMIRNWRSTVKDSDTVYVLGDFACRNYRPVSSYLNEMDTGARIIYVRGNHDQFLDEMSPEEKQRHFQVIIPDTCVIERYGFKIGLSHAPREQFSVPVDLIVCGHIHNNRAGEDFERFMSIPNILNCGVDVNHFKPVTLRELCANNERFYGRKYSVSEEMFQAFE